MARARSTVSTKVLTDPATGEKRIVTEKKVEIREPKDPNAKLPTPDEKFMPWHRSRKRPPGTWGARKARISRRDLEDMIFGENGKCIKEFPLEPDGRPVLGMELAVSFIDAISKGVLEGRFAMIAGVNRAVLRQLCRDLGLYKQYREAVKEGYDAIAEDALTIASTPVEVEEVVESYDKEGNLIRKDIRKSDNVQSRKLAYEARVTLLGKWNPEKYGNKVEVKTDVNTANAIMNARKRLDPVEVVDVEEVKNGE